MNESARLRARMGPRRCFVRTPIVAGTLSLIAAVRCMGTSITTEPPPPTASEVRQNIRDGFAATAGFEIVPLVDVPRSRHVGRSHALTVALDPSSKAFDADGIAFQRLTHVTLAWTVPEQLASDVTDVELADGRQPPFVFDLFLHGDGTQDDEWAVRVPCFDIRKFFHQSCAALEVDAALVKVQAYFAEFSRKAKILRRACPGGGTSTACWSPYDWQTLRTVVRLIADVDAPASGVVARVGAVAADLAGNETRDGTPRELLDRTLTSATAAVSELTRSGLSPESLGPMTRALDEIAVVQRITAMKLVNNCREPGNYELSLRDAIDTSLLRANFAFPVAIYDGWLRRYHGLGIREQATGIRVPNTIREVEPERYPDDASFPRVFPTATVEMLRPLRHGRDESPVHRGRIEPRRGRIPYVDYRNEEREVGRKSTFIRSGNEPLSYVEVDAGKQLPLGFHSPADTDPTTYWRDPKNQGKVVPHRFETFEDLQTYGVHLSGFEANGLYVGKSKYQLLGKEGPVGRVRFEFGYLAQLTRFELRGHLDSVFELRLLSDGGGDEGDEGVQFVFGNQMLDVDGSVGLQFGIGEQRLIDDYDEDPEQERLPYALAYDTRGVILDHHRAEIGVERVRIERRDPTTIVLRLMSHERIVPVWEGVVDTARR